MLHLVLGTDWTANRDYILDQLRKDVAQEKQGRILMVPELISHETERRLCAVAGDTASRFAEVLSFTRLAKRVADGMGRTAEECLDQGGRVVAMACAARQLHSRLKTYASLETKPEFLTGLIDAVDEFKRCCISAADLAAAAQQSQGTLAQKLEELALLLESYDALCALGKRDPRDLETQLLEQLEQCDFAQKHVFYIDGFPDFTRQHLAIMEHLIRYAPSVTVSLNCDSIDSGLMAFEKAGDTASKLFRWAKNSGVEVQIHRVPERREVLQGMRRSLFQGQLAAGSQHGALRVLHTEGMYDECLAAAEQVMTLVRQGCRYRDITVVCCDMGSYEPLLKLVFRRCGIPLYLSGKEDILGKSVIATVVSAMDAALGNFEQRDVLRYLRSVLSPMDPDTCDLVENYAITWGIRGKRWLNTWENHPDGLGAEWNDESEMLLERLNQARRTAIEPLAQLRLGFQNAKRLSDQVLALYQFLQEIRLEERLDELAQEMDAQGDNRSAQILNQLWEILLGALEQLYDVLGDTKWDQDTFTRLFRLLLSQYDVGTIPPVLDAVQAGPITSMRCHQQRHLIVLGAQEGNLPGYSGSTGILSDQERVALRELGVPLTGGAMEGIQAEFAEIYGVFCGADETVSVSYSGGQPSFICRRLADLAGGEQSAKPTLGIAASDRTEAGAYLARYEAAELAQQLGVEADYHAVCRRREYRLGCVERQQVANLYGKRLKLSASQVDCQAECRLSYFLKYGLKAKERKEATVDPAEFGTYVHAVLEQTGRRIMELGGFHRVTLEQTLEIAEGFSDAYAREHFEQLDSQRLTYLFRRNSQEVRMIVEELWQELQESQFQPAGFEVGFGSDHGLAAIDIHGATMDAILRGFVDRVDTWQESGNDYYRVVDYKTGKKDFDYCDVFNGVGLQMILYLFALQEQGTDVVGTRPIPAGVQYFPARVPYISSDGRLTEEEAEQERRKERKRKGLLLKDEQVLQAMEPGDEPKRLSYTVKKDGTLTGDLADRDQLKQLKAYVFRILGQIVEEIASGNVEPNPYTRGTSHSACTFCPYDAICHRTTVEGRRNYKSMTAQRFWEEIEKELNGHG